jgi:hypothetical protein
MTVFAAHQALQTGRTSSLRKVAAGTSKGRVLPAVTAIADCVSEIVSSIRVIRETSLDEPLSLTEASRCYGYPVDHVGRLVREAKIPNVGRKNEIPEYVMKKHEVHAWLKNVVPRGLNYRDYVEPLKAWADRPDSDIEILAEDAESADVKFEIRQR